MWADDQPSRTVANGEPMYASPAVQPGPAEVREAIRADRLALALQPIWETGSQRLAGHEALVRLRQPDGGVQAAAAWLPQVLAADASLAQALGNWMLDAGLGWLAEHPEVPSLHLNVTPHELSTLGYVGAVGGGLWRRGLDPHRLVLELVESERLTEVAAITPAVAALADLGVRLALDDFGFGPTPSVQLLQVLPVTLVKIDRAVVQADGVRDRAILAGLVGLVHAAEATVVVEGVETPAHLDAVVEAGADAWQGYLGGAPQLTG